MMSSRAKKCLICKIFKCSPLYELKCPRDISLHCPGLRFEYFLASTIRAMPPLTLGSEQMSSGTVKPGISLLLSFPLFSPLSAFSPFPPIDPSHPILPSTAPIKPSPRTYPAIHPSQEVQGGGRRQHHSVRAQPRLEGRRQCHVSCRTIRGTPLYWRWVVGNQSREAT